MFNFKKKIVLTNTLCSLFKRDSSRFAVNGISKYLLILYEMFV